MGSVVSPSECRWFTNSYTNPSSGLGDQIQRNYRMKEENNGAAAYISLPETKLEKSATWFPSPIFVIHHPFKRRISKEVGFKTTEIVFVLLIW